MDAAAKRDGFFAALSTGPQIMGIVNATPDSFSDGGVQRTLEQRVEQAAAQLAAGADVIPLAEALGYDARIGRRFLSPGLGFGGGCLPKDVRAFRASAAALGVDSIASLLTSVDAINQGRRDRVVALAREAGLTEEDVV